MVRFCYVDESGCTGMLPSATSPIQPVLVIACITVHQAHIKNLTLEFLDLKRRFFPALTPQNVPPLSHVRVEIKGAELRTNIRNGGRNRRRHSLGYLDGFVKLLEHYQAKIFGRVWIKGIGIPINGRAIYTSSIQAICGDFQKLLESENNYGVIVADSRTPVLNAGVSHSIFTQKFRAAGDSYSRVLEMPTFGHSENHVGLQLADLLNSGLLFPIACYAYCAGYINNVHIHGKYAHIKKMFGPRLLALTYRYNESGRTRGGITVDDKLGARNNALMFN